MNYPPPEFVNNIATQTAEQLVARYSTHIMLDISIGGSFRLNYNDSVYSESDYTKKTSDIRSDLASVL